MIGIVGGGIMGSGIAQVCAQSGLRVIVIEASTALCEKTRMRIEQSIDRGIEKKLLKKSCNFNYSLIYLFIDNMLTFINFTICI